MVLSRFSTAAVLLALSMGAGPTAFAAPKIQFESETVDFGKVRGGDPITVTYKLTNVGDAELQITSIKPGCGCTKAEAAKKAIAPKESTTIDAIFNSTGFSGAISKTIAVTTNDPDRASLSLSLKGQVVPLATVTPPSISFGDLLQHNSTTFTLKVVPTDPATFGIIGIEPIGTHVTVKSFRRLGTKAAPYWQVVVVINAGAKTGRVMESLRIRTTAPGNPSVSVTVYGNVIDLDPLAKP